jgi:molybdenum cofactor biosynthesis protein B
VGHREHRQHAPASLRCGILTVSDTRGEAGDETGRRIRARLEKAGHRVAEYRVVPDEPWAIAWTLQEWCLRDELDAILINGGTGIARRDRTADTVDSMLEARLPGFGERFRSRSESQVGTAAIMSGAVAGVRNGKALFALPGSPQAAELALDQLILPEIGHLVGELRR